MPRFWSYVRRANLVDALAVVKPLANLIGALQRELPAYQVAVKGATIDHTETKDNHAFTDGVLHWWRVNGNKFPAWAQAARIILAFTCNSAGAKRVFSMIKARFADQQSDSMADYIPDRHHAPRKQAPCWLSERGKAAWCVCAAD